MPDEIIIARAGGPEVFRTRALLPRPLAANEIRVEVAAAGVNFADVLGRMGTYPDAPAIPFAPGYEVSGTVTEVGADVTGVAVGDRVCALTEFGGYSEEVVVEDRQCFPVPDGVDTVLAAAVPVTHLTAHTCLFEAGGLRPGHTVLIHGGAGGVGSVAIQMARKLDVTIVATAGSEAKVAWLRGQGVHHPINYNEPPDLAARVAELTGGRGVDLVLDPLGGRNIARSVAMCAPLGRVILFGASSLNPGKRRDILALLREGLPMRFFNLLPLFDKNVGIHAINMLHLARADPALIQHVMAEILSDVARGDLEPIIAEHFALSPEGATRAHHYIQDRKNIGKVLLVAAGT